MNENGLLAVLFFCCAWVAVAWINRNKPRGPLFTVDASGGGAGVRILNRGREV